ncbi:MAG: glycosyltransferase [Bacteroidetes bacterium]|nr:glycosyltransferase [Bacteroidota bacterium]MBL6942825.1 glycosyltransferase [Bacteroidales bacterium]
MWVIFGVTIGYLIVIGIISYGWFSLSTPVNKQESNPVVNVSVVIAVRNESRNIQNLLRQIVNQNYNSNSYEIIIVNDHSTDNTIQLVNQVLNKHPDIKIKVIEARGEGKKSALKEGIEISSAQLIVTTDGDCHVKQGWLLSIVNYYNLSGCKLIIGPVIYEHEKTILQKMFSLDFVSLVASGAGSAGVGLPLMGNGANLAFERNTYNEISSRGNQAKYASGDDVFLIHKVTSRYGAKAVGFLRNNDAIVSTLPPLSLYDFFDQRKRWASKAMGYRTAWPVIVSLTVFFFNAILFIMLASSLYFTWLLPVYIMVIITKFLIDMPLVFNFLSFAQKPNLKPILFLMEFVYPLYIVMVAITSFIFRFDWKGRSQLK